jgi:hypothetical protein
MKSQYKAVAAKPIKSTQQQAPAPARASASEDGADIWQSMVNRMMSGI